MKAKSSPTPTWHPPSIKTWPPSKVGVVVIGRNEASRLAECLASVTRIARAVVYVDSGSTDGSIALAERCGTHTIELSSDLPFSAARARNAGADWLRAHVEGLEYIQFLDGDCLLEPEWMATALAFMTDTPDAAALCGRRRERYPEASWYNRLCDIEWDTPVGIVSTCGGDALMRLAALDDVGGFAPELIAGEEPDLCHRFRRAGWTIHRLDRDMSCHDAAMTRFGQWWQRNRRSGYAMAEGLARRGREDPGLIRTVLSNLLWSLPVAWPFWPILWLLVMRRRGALYASFVVLGKLPHLQGQLDFWKHPPTHLRTLIEYK